MIVDGEHEVLVELTDQSSYHFNLKLTLSSNIFNIYRDDQKGCLVSGGDQPGQNSKRVARPHALKFWNDFNGGKDPPSKMTGVNDAMKGFGNRPRFAREHVLKVGDKVAVLGTLRKSNGGMKIEADSHGEITNDPCIAPALKTCSCRQPATNTVGEPVLMKMEKSSKVRTSSR